MIITNLSQLLSTLNTQMNIKQLIAIIFKTILKHKLNSYINKNIHTHIFIDKNTNKSNNDSKKLNDILDIITFNGKNINILENVMNGYINIKQLDIPFNINFKLVNNDDTLK